MQKTSKVAIVNTSRNCTQTLLSLWKYIADTKHANLGGIKNDELKTPASIYFSCKVSQHYLFKHA